MKTDRPSRTAHLVALGRAMADLGISHVPDFHDPTAAVFLNDKGKQSLAKVQHAALEGKDSFRLKAARGMADMIALRTAAIDKAVRSAIGAGATQLVILGAGYDGRAWRMSELAGVKVFEVDRSATQEDKRARLGQLPAANSIVNFVPIDFEHESLDSVLASAGHDPSLPTCWIWEGVVMYLRREVMHATLTAIAARSATGSRLIVNYHEAHGGFIGRLMFRLIGEPQISNWTPADMAGDLRDVGFVVREDSGMTDWNEQFANSEARVERGYYMRVAVAAKP